MKKYKLLVCGGTFDLLHKGHKSFLKQVLEISEKAIIGLTSDAFAQNKNQEIESFEARKKSLKDFLDLMPGNYEITEIENTYGPLLTSDYIPDAIVATLDTKEGAEEINRSRKEKRLPVLAIILIDMEKAEDGKVISSSRIRKGEINREGRLFIRPNWQNRVLSLPDFLRDELGNPFGEVLSKVPEDIDGGSTICVGDVTVRKFNERNVGQFLSIVDFNVQRKKEFKGLEELGFPFFMKEIKVVNKHGTISSELLNIVARIFLVKEEQVILVDGEEDLAVIPVILCSPLGFKVYYGQPNDGLVEVIVTEKMKEKVFDLVNKFYLE